MSGISNPLGTKATCTAQAFFGQAVVATVSYNTVLAVQYLMIIKLNISESQIAKRYEKIMHSIPIFIWLITGIIGLSCGVFNPAFFNCEYMKVVCIFMCFVLVVSLL